MSKLATIMRTEAKRRNVPPNHRIWRVAEDHERIVYNPIACARVRASAYDKAQRVLEEVKETYKV